MTMSAPVTTQATAPARIAVIGTGGLGGPVAYALAHAGARLLICDDDIVDLSNLQRQVQYSTRDIGRLKVEALADELVRRGHSRGDVQIVSKRFDADSAPRLMQDVDVIVDGSDNFATKFEVNDQAMAVGTPFVIGSVARYSGQIMAIAPGSHHPTASRGGCYRCLFEEPPAAGDAETCADAGVLGAAVAVIGGLMARAALALARGDDPLGGALWVIDDLRAPAVREVRFSPRSTCAACGDSQSSPSRKEFS